MTLAIGYIRRSVVKSGKPTLSPQRQQDGIADYCQEREWDVEYFSDAEGHRSGRTEKGRPEWLRLKARVQATQPGEIAAVIVYVLDRTARSGRDFLNFLHLLQEKRIEYVSVTQPFLDTTTAAGRAFVAMLAIWAELEADIDSERISADIAYRQQSGLFVGRCPPGYTRQVINGGRLMVPNEHSKYVVQLYERYATGQHSYRQLVNWINTELDWPTVDGGPWTHKHVQIVLEDWQVYTGQVTRHRKRGGNEVYPGKHQPLITEELAQRCLAVRAQRQDKRLFSRKESAKQVYLLTPVLRCAGCGQQLRGRVSHGDRIYAHYQKGCAWSIVHADKIEQQVLDYFRDWTLPPDIEREIEMVAKRQMAATMITEDSAKQLAKLKQRKERALRLYEMGERDEDWLKLTLTEINGAIGKLTPHVVLPYSVGNLANVIRQFHALLNNSETTPDMLRAMLGQMFERIETNGEVITRMIPRHWFRDFYENLIAGSPEPRDIVYPQGTLTSQHVAAVRRLIAMAQ